MNDLMNECIYGNWSDQAGTGSGEPEVKGRYLDRPRGKKKQMNMIIKIATIMEHSRTKDVEQNIGW